MDDFGFFRARSYVPTVKIADPDHNVNGIIEACLDACKENVDCIVFPELSITGYTCADLFQQELLIKKAEKGIERLAKELHFCDLLTVVGSPVMAFGKRYNCAVFIHKDKIVGIVPKSFLPNYEEFYEKRWFESGRNIKGAYIDFAGSRQVPFGTDLIFEFTGAKIGAEVCEDLWVPAPPSGELAIAGANVILNLSASDELAGKHDYVISLVSQQSARCRCAYVYSSAGWGESSTDLVFSGKALIAEDGVVYGGDKRFIRNSFHETKDIDLQKLNLDRARFNTFTEKDQINSQFRYVIVSPPLIQRKKSINFSGEINRLPFVPSNPDNLNQRCEEIINIQAYGLMKRLDAIRCKKAIIGISGGLDSTLALLVTVEAFDKLNIPRKGIIGITMPGFATTSRTKNNAQKLMENLGVTSLEIPIGEAVKVHFSDIGQDPHLYDAAYENSQARERTQILMDVANKEGGIVIGTGDMSELALGWCTYNGDQMSMYGVNASVPKTLVRHLVNWMASKSESKTAEILTDICETPISPELVPSSADDEIAQKTEDLVGPYELHDFFLYYFLGKSFEPAKIYFLALKAFEGKYDGSTILKWLKVFIQRFFSQQFKRSCMPDGPKVGSVNLSPRGDWRMPSDASCNMWLKQLEELENER